MGGQTQPAGTDQELTGLVRELMLVTRHFVLEVADSYRGDDRLERSAFILLSRIEAEGPMSIGQLADAFGLDVSTVNRQTAAMLRAGVAERIPDPGGGLARKLRITGEGRRRLRKERDWSVNGLRQVLQDWAPEEIGQLLAALTRFNQSIEELSGKPWPRPADSIPQENQDQFGTRPDGSLRLPATKALRDTLLAGIDRGPGPSGQQGIRFGGPHLVAASSLPKAWTGPNGTIGGPIEARLSIQ